MSANEIVEARKAKPCPISRSDFMASATDLAVDVMGQKLAAKVKDFKPDSQGKASFGWHGFGKGVITFGDIAVPVQINIHVTCIGSKDAPP